MRADDQRAPNVAADTAPGIAGLGPGKDAVSPRRAQGRRTALFVSDGWDQAEGDGWEQAEGGEWDQAGGGGQAAGAQGGTPQGHAIARGPAVQYPIFFFRAWSIQIRA